jgi:peptidoglycan/LPS O-acetylase OafA/YrhL
MGLASPSRDNNFDILRLALATLVILSHSFPLTGHGPEEWLLVVSHEQTWFGNLAVDGFFVLSGFLITQSWLRSPTGTDYIRKRFLRIFPGFFAALLVSGAFAVRYSPDPVAAAKGLAYRNPQLVRGALLLDSSWPELPDAFGSNPFHSVNGSLWTLQPELACYGLTAAIGAIGLFGRPKFVVALAAGTFAVFVLDEAWLGDSLWWRLVAHFLAGSAFQLFAGRVLPPRWPIAVGCAVVLAVSARLPRPAWSLCSPWAFGYLLLCVAHTPPVGRRLTKRCDLSYGVYLYAFPIQQALVATGVRDPIVLFACAAPLSFTAATASWLLVEQPCLQFRRPRLTPP